MLPKEMGGRGLSSVSVVRRGGGEAAEREREREEVTVPCGSEHLAVEGLHSGGLPALDQYRTHKGLHVREETGERHIHRSTIRELKEIIDLVTNVCTVNGKK